MSEQNLNDLFEQGMERGKQRAIERLTTPAQAQVSDNVKLNQAEERTPLQILFDLVSERASSKDFNVVDYSAPDDGFILETVDERMGNDGKRCYPNIDVKGRGKNFTVLLENEEGEQKAKKVTMEEAAQMVAVYIGQYTPSN